VAAVLDEEAGAHIQHACLLGDNFIIWRHPNQQSNKCCTKSQQQITNGKHGRRIKQARGTTIVLSILPDYTALQKERKLFNRHKLFTS
jgi:hypothetical protein